MSSMTIGEIRKDMEGMHEVPELTAAHILGFPRALKEFLRWVILKKGVTCEQLAGLLAETEDNVQPLVDELAGLGLIERLPICGVPRYRVCLIPRSLRPPLELLNMVEE